MYEFYSVIDTLLFTWYHKYCIQGIPFFGIHATNVTLFCLWAFLHLEESRGYQVAQSGGRQVHTHPYICIHIINHTHPYTLRQNLEMRIVARGLLKHFYYKGICLRLPSLKLSQESVSQTYSYKFRFIRLP